MNNLEFARVMQKRTKAFAIQAVRCFNELPRTEPARILGRQLLRSATSVAANYRAACRSKSPKDFISKIGTVVEEADESLFWLELLEEAEIGPATAIDPLKREADELLRITSASLDTARRNQRKRRRK